MKKYTWADAIYQALLGKTNGASCDEIAKIIIEQNLVPPNTESQDIEKSVKGELYRNPKFINSNKNIFILHEYHEMMQDNMTDIKLHTAFGLFWQREKVDWAKCELMGFENNNSNLLNFNKHFGIYLLYNSAGEIIYVGKTIDKPIINRLHHHTIKGKVADWWTKFSWFGWYPSIENKNNTSKQFSTKNMISCIEAILIEGINPKYNRNSAPKFNGTKINQKQ